MVSSTVKAVFSPLEAGARLTHEARYIMVINKRNERPGVGIEPIFREGLLQEFQRFSARERVSKAEVSRVIEDRVDLAIDAVELLRSSLKERCHNGIGIKHFAHHAKPRILAFQSRFPDVPESAIDIR